MVEITKEDVLDWYSSLNASHRVEVVCALLDHSLPFELRFLGSVIENFGRKDFHILREAENKANSLHTSADGSPDVAAILKMLSEGPAPPNITVNQQGMASTASNIGQQQQQHVAGGGQHSHSNTGPSTSDPTVRPSPTTLNNERRPIVDKLPKSHLAAGGTVVENGLPSNKSSSPRSLNSDGKDAGERVQVSELSNHTEVNSEEENGPRKDLWLHDRVKRRKLILYLSLMSATNHDSANLYYLLLSDVDELLENLDWLKGLEESNQDEVLLLYTIGAHHPAFNFEQRTFLATVINRFKDCMIRYSKDCDPTYPHASHYNHINQHYFPQQFIYYPQMMPSNQAPNPNQALALGTHVGTTEGVRAPTPSYNPYTQYPPYAMYMTHQQPTQNNPQQQYQAHSYHQGSIFRLQNSLMQCQVGSQPVVLLPGSTSAPSPNSGSGQLPGGKGQSQNLSSHHSGALPQRHLHHTSVSTPSRTQNQTNSACVDGDSEGSSENGAWDSPESSSFESPPQSLTPSRSQSPRLSQTKPTVHSTNPNSNSGSATHSVVVNSSTASYSQSPRYSQTNPAGHSSTAPHSNSGSATHSVVINSSTPGYPQAGPHMSHSTSVGTYPGFQQPSYGSVVSPGGYRPNNPAAMINRPAVFMTNHGSVMNNQQNNLMNYSLPFSIPPQQLGSPNYSKPFLNSPNNLLSKDLPLNSLPSFAIGSGDNTGLIHQPSPMTNAPRPRSFAGKPTTGLPAAGGDFPVQSSVDNALVPGLDDPIDVSCRPMKISCYNCGSNQHIGPECKELSMEEMTKMQYRLNYGGDTNDGTE